MFLHYFKRKENRHKDFANNKYTELLTITHQFIKDNNLKNDNLNVSLDILSILLIILFNFLKVNKSDENKLVAQEIMNLFIKDLDHSFKQIGIGDMSIGKYVKFYVKKFYFRVKIYEKHHAFNSKDNWHDFIEGCKINILKENQNIFYVSIFEFYKNLTNHSKIDNIFKLSLLKLIK